MPVTSCPALWLRQCRITMHRDGKFRVLGCYYNVISAVITKYVVMAQYKMTRKCTIPPHHLPPQHHRHRRRRSYPPYNKHVSMSAVKGKTPCRLEMLTCTMDSPYQIPPPLSSKSLHGSTAQPHSHTDTHTAQGSETHRP